MGNKLLLKNKMMGGTVLILFLLLLLPFFGCPKVNAEDNVDKLIRKLQDKHPSARAKAVKELANLKDARAVAPLINSLKDADSYVRGQSARALGKLKDARAVAPLINGLKDDFTHVRQESAKSLGEINDARAVGPLIDFLKEDSSYAREEAAKSLIKLGPDAIAPLLKAEKENDSKRMSEIYSFFICRGESGSEPLLIDGLFHYGNEKMAEDFAHSGNGRLKDAAYKWAENHRYKIRDLPGPDGNLVWGRCSEP